MSAAALRGLGLTQRQADTLRLLAKLGATCLSQATATAWAAVGVERPVGERLAPDS